MGDLTKHEMQQIDRDRMAVLFDHVMTQGHTVQIKKLGEHYAEIECVDNNGKKPCGEDGEPWWDHWDWTVSYAEYVKEQVDEGIKLNGQ